MRKLVLLLVLLVAFRDGLAAEPAAVRPFESPPGAVQATRLDAIVAAAQRKKGVEPANPCSDEVFVRRVHLDVIGTLPEPAAVSRFLSDTRKDKRAALVESLFARPEFADYWSQKWCDVLRVKSEFPINLWPNAVQAYHRWVRDAVRENRPFDKVARDLLTSSGSNFRVPPVNFYRAVQGREPQAIAAAVALTFLGERTESWTPRRRDQMAVFFSKVAFKPTNEWKEEIVLLDPAPKEPIDAVLPDGTLVRVGEDDDPRVAFADWLLDPKNPRFARSVVNRVWAWLLGRGIVHEPDDIRPDNPPAIPELLAHLEKEFAGARFDMRQLFRLILNSRTYQQSPIPRGPLEAAEPMFACYPVRRLDAEVLIDALDWIGGTGESYSSVVPEPYTFVPEDHRTIGLADGSITSPFLEMFGRPARDTGLASERGTEVTGTQRRYLLNSTDVQRRIERSPRIRAVLEASAGSDVEAIRGTYLTLLSRAPLPPEEDAAERYFRAGGRPHREAVFDLAWALVNSAEFLFRH